MVSFTLVSAMLVENVPGCSTPIARQILCRAGISITIGMVTASISSARPRLGRFSEWWICRERTPRVGAMGSNLMATMRPTCGHSARVGACLKAAIRSGDTRCQLRALK